MSAIGDKAYALCIEIEKLPASEQQTGISLMASDLHRTIETALSVPRPREEALERLLRDVRPYVEMEENIAVMTDIVRAAGEDVFRHEQTIREKNARIERLTEGLVYADEHLLLGRPDLASRDIDDALSGTTTTAKLVPVERLREIEWSGEIQSETCCPACTKRERDWTNGTNEYRVHAPDCWLGAALREEA